MNTDLNEDKGLASNHDRRDVKLELISEANANSLVSTSCHGEHRHSKKLLNFGFQNMLNLTKFRYL